MDEKQHLFFSNNRIYISYEDYKIPGGRSATSIELPTYDHDPEVKFGEDQILILWSIWNPHLLAIPA